MSSILDTLLTPNKDALTDVTQIQDVMLGSSINLILELMITVISGLSQVTVVMIQIAQNATLKA